MDPDWQESDQNTQYKRESSPLSPEVILQKEPATVPSSTGFLSYPLDEFSVSVTAASAFQFLFHPYSVTGFLKPSFRWKQPLPPLPECH